MKRICLLLTLICLCVCCLVFMTSCAEELSAPQEFKLDEHTQTLSWKKVKDAVGYTITIGEDEVVTRANSYSLEKLEPGEYVIKVRANGDGDKLKDSGTSEYTFTREYETGLRYKLINNNREYQLVGIGTASGDVVMESVYRGKRVTSIADSALSGNSRITSFVIGDYVESIGKKAFYNSKALVSITIPEGVKTIGVSAFQTCGKLTSVTIPSTVTALPDYAFGFCRALESVTLSANTKTIGFKAFTTCEALTSITIPDSVITIGSDCFSGCDLLEMVVLSKNLTAVPSNAFYKCKALKSITLGDCVTSVGDYAFSECELIEKIVIPDSVQSIGQYSFAYCDALNEVTLGTGVCEIGYNAFLSTKIYNDTENLIKIGNWIIDCKNKEITQDVLNPLLDTSTVGIATAAFMDCTAISGIKLPNVVYIGDYAFANCTGLSGYPNIQFSEDLKVIGDYAFAACKLVDAFNFGKALTTIETYAFYNCPRLAEVDLPDTVTKIGTRAFNGTGIYTAATSLVYADNWLVGSKSGYGDIEIKSGTVGIADYCFYKQFIGAVDFPSSLRIIGRSAFYECIMISVDDFPQGLKQIGDYAFYNCYYGSFGGDDYILNIPLGVEYIGRSAFYQSQICGVAIPGTVKSIGDYAFWGCALLGAQGITDADGNFIVNGVVKLGEGITSIGSRAFYGCAGLETIVIPDSVTHLGERVFNKCTSLKNVSIGSGLTVVGDYMFYNCTSLEKIVISDGVTAINKYAFRGCENLKEVTFGNNIEYIGDYAFLGCSSLTSLVIPSSVKEIGRYAFRGLTALTSVYIGENVDVIGQHAFYGCNNATIYCEGDSLARLWSDLFNSSFRPIIFNAHLSEDGTYVESFTVAEGSIDNHDALVGISASKRDGYTCIGWSTSPGGEVEYNSETIINAPTGTTLYAVYIENDGSEGSDDSQTPDTTNIANQTVFSV